MKTLILCGFCICASTGFAQKPADVRVVEGVAEDIDRSDDWFHFDGSVVQVIEPGTYLVRGRLQDRHWNFADGTYYKDYKFYLLRHARPGLADDSRISDERVKLLGPTSYKSVQGATKTVKVLDVGELYVPPPPRMLTPSEAAKAAQARETEKVAAAARLLKYHQEMAAKGYASAQCSLGKRYLAGDGVPKDLALARAWLEKAAAQDNAEAQAALAALKN